MTLNTPSLSGSPALIRSPAASLVTRTKPQSLHSHLRQHAGYTLTEVMLGLGIVAVAGAGMYYLFGRTDVSAQVKSEQDNVNSLIDNASKAYGRVGSFAGMSNSAAIAQGWVPKSLVRNGQLRNTWDTPVTVQPETVNGRTNAGLRLTYSNVSSDVCNKLATAIASSMWDVQVEGETIMGEQGQVDVPTMLSRCNTSNAVDVSFVHYDGALGVLAAADPLVLPCPPAQQQALACPPGEFGYIQQERTAICGPTGDWGGTAADWNAWATVRDTCDPNIDCVAAGTCPPPLIPAPQACVPPPAQQRNTGCPAGMVGANMQERTASCPSTTGAYTWSSWADAPGGNSCTPAGACPAPQTRTASCPAGMIPGAGGQGVVEQRDCTGVSGGTTSWGEWYLSSSDCIDSAPVAVACWEEEPPTCPPPSSCNLPTPNPETRDVACEAPRIGPQLQHRQAYCLGTGGGADNWEWSGWYNIGEPDPRCYTCPPDDTENQDVPENRVLTACPAGQYGSTPQTRLHHQSRTRNYTCPASGGPGTPNPWTAWADVSVDPWSPAAVCTPCPAPASVPQTQWIAGTCPAGTLGTIEIEQSRTNTVAYSCPANTATLPAGVTTPGTWSPTGATRNSTCAPPCTVPSPSTVTTLGAWSGWYALYACSDIHGPGMDGDYLQRSRPSCVRTYSCPAPTGAAVLSPAPGVCTDIYEETNNCTPGAAPIGCVNPPPGSTPSCPSGGNQSGGSWVQAAAPTCTWSYNGGSCPAPPAGCPAAPATPSCPSGIDNYVWNASPAPTCWTLSGSCAPPAPSCGAAPPTPACGGGNINTYAWNAAPAPTCWTLSGACTAPAPTTGSWVQTGHWAYGPYDEFSPQVSGSGTFNGVFYSYSCVLTCTAGVSWEDCPGSCASPGESPNYQAFGAAVAQACTIGDSYTQLTTDCWQGASGGTAYCGKDEVTVECQ